MKKNIYILKKFSVAVIFLTLASCGMDPGSTESRNQRLTIEVVQTTSNATGTTQQSDENQTTSDSPSEEKPSIPKCILAADSAAAYVGDEVSLSLNNSGMPTKVLLNEELVDLEINTIKRTITNNGSNFFELKVTNDLGMATCLVMVIGVEK